VARRRGAHLRQFSKRSCHYSALSFDHTGFSFQVFPKVTKNSFVRGQNFVEVHILSCHPARLFSLVNLYFWNALSLQFGPNEIAGLNFVRLVTVLSCDL